MAISLQFIGAARHVTGSKHLLTVNNKKILLDCGMVQGPRKIAARENRELGLDSKKIDAVVLSHGHIDHSGSLPRLVKLGFNGAIHCTEATQDLLNIMLADSAHIQANDAKYLAKRGHRFQPPYDIDDVQQTLSQVRPAPYYQKVRVCKEVTVEFLDAGHILGSAFVILDVDDGGQRKTIVFTGDHGRRDMPILRNPDPLPPCDVIITESTYGDRRHPPNPDLEEALEEVVLEEMRDGGRILIPAFSVGRTQNLLLFLGKLMKEKRIPQQAIYIDSPLSKKATNITACHPEVYDEETQKMLAEGHNPFHFPGVRYVADVEESKSLNEVRQGIILSASGMCEAGRILHHLQTSIGRPEDCVLAVGFMAQGTLGRKLVEGFEHVKIFGDTHEVRCKVRSIRGLSAHADYEELLNSIRPHKDRARVFVVHGEENPAMIFAGKLEQLGVQQVDVPVRGEVFEL